ncbi:zona pellucida-like domain containing protein [Dermatophagoides farinae]|uniref:Zona pellucida-like domain containing protein n=1 Tax=Dermatophagoides farinae TaxID=6954 RepID=A0A9D4P477_DERFA|nr:zona pellucida-like domain containing protein [Dermatophagoides farinae]
MDIRFTGSLALYLECDIHMCHNRCPPQRCYWRNLSKRSAKLQNFDTGLNTTTNASILSESISLVQALEVHHDQDEEMTFQSSKDELGNKQNEEMICLRPIGIISMILFFLLLLIVSFGTSIRYWIRIRKLKYLKHNNIYNNDYHKSTPLSTPSSSLDYRNHHNHNHHHHQHQHDQSAPNTTRTICSMNGFSDTPNSVSVFPYRDRFCRFS